MLSRFLTHPIVRTIILLFIYLGYGNFHSWREQRVQAAAGVVATPGVSPSPKVSPSAALAAGAADCAASAPGAGIDDKGECAIPKKPARKKSKKVSAP
jgi:hypothetical protein